MDKQIQQHGVKKTFIILFLNMANIWSAILCFYASSHINSFPIKSAHRILLPILAVHETLMSFD